MQVTVETTEGLERKMRVTIPADEFQSQVDEKIKQTAQRVRLNGFRPGKVPLREVKRRFGDGIRQEVSGEVIQSTYGEALQQEDISPAGMPQIEEVKFDEGQDLEYTAVFEVFPEVEVNGLEAIEIEKPVSEVVEADIDKMIETLQEQRTTFEEAERASQEGDQVNIDYTGFVDDEAFEGGHAEGTDLVLGSGNMIPGFEDGLMGLSAGDEKDVEVTFPEEYHAENLAGKAAVFKMKVNKVSEPKKPELDDEFFKQFDVEEGGIDAFRAEIKTNMERELEAAVKAKLKDQVMDGIAAGNEVDLPKALVDQEVNRMRQEAVQRFGGGPDMNLDPSMLPAEMFTDQAEQRVKLGLLVNRLVEQNDIKVDDDKVRETIETMAASYEQPEQVVNFYYSNEAQLSQIQNMVLEEQIVDHVMALAKVSEAEMSYEDAVKRTPPEAEAAEDDSAEDTADAAEGESEDKSEGKADE